MIDIRNNIKIMHCNTRSFRNPGKQLELINEIHQQNIDFLLVNETWFKQKDNFNIKNFKLHRRDRPHIKTGGGVAIYSHSSIKTTRLDIPKIFENLEIIGIQIEQEDPIQIFSYYNPPSQKLSTELFKYINNTYKNSLIIGDLNASHQSWHCKSNNSAGTELYNCITENNFHVLNNNRSTYIPKFNILDLSICTNNLLTYITNFYVGKDIGSDHFPTITTIRLKNHIQQQQRYFLNWELFKKTLSSYQEVKYEEINLSNLNQIAEELQKRIVESYKSSFQLISKKNKYNFINKEVSSLLEIKKKIRRLYQKHKTEVFKSALNKINKKIKSVVQDNSSKKWLDLCSNWKNSSKLWKKINNIEKNSDQITNHNLIINNETVTDCQIIADAFATSLTETFKLNIDMFNPPIEAVNFQLPNTDRSEADNIVKISQEEFDQSIRSQNIKSAPGEDGITNQMLIHCPQNIKSSIINIFNFSIVNHTIPTKWKVAKIIMIKKPNKPETDISSYRPISLLSNISKLLEKIINTRLINYLESNNLISIHQSGFRKHRSTKDHILRLTQDIKSNFNQNKYTGAVLFDVSKAFDRTWHNGILFKLHNLNIPIYITRWINDFLTNRNFFINFNNCVSISCTILSGVPQGSTLSPTLFTIYISDIDSINLTKIVKIALYADDLCIWISSKNLNDIEKALQSAVEIITDFFQTWCLDINVQKTSYSIFTTAGHRKSYEKIYKIKLLVNLDPYPKLLGITFDPKLAFNQHFQNIINKATPKINILRILKSKIKNNKRFLINIYKILIRSIMDYSDLIIATTKESSTLILQKLQNRILRICLNAPLFTSTSSLHNIANLPTVKERALTLAKQYVNKAVQSNDLIKLTIIDYESNKQLYEGSNIVGRLPSTTPLAILTK